MTTGQPMQQNPPGWGQPPQPGPQGYGYQGYNPYPPEDVEQGKMMAVLGYLISPIWIIPLLQRDNAFSLYHAKQAMVYTIIMSIVGMLIGIISAVTCGFGAVLAVGIFVLMYPWIMAIVYSANGEYRPMPWIGHYADQWFGSLVADKRPGAQPPGYPQQ